MTLFEGEGRCQAKNGRKEGKKLKEVVEYEGRKEAVGIQGFVRS
jgi:hypothetical protein